MLINVLLHAWRAALYQSFAVFVSVSGRFRVSHHHTQLSILCCLCLCLWKVPRVPPPHSTINPLLSLSLSLEGSACPTTTLTRAHLHAHSHTVTLRKVDQSQKQQTKATKPLFFSFLRRLPLSCPSCCAGAPLRRRLTPAMKRRTCCRCLVSLQHSGTCIS